MISNEALRARGRCQAGQGCSTALQEEHGAALPPTRLMALGESPPLKGLCFPTYKPKAAPLLIPKGPSGSELSALGQWCVASGTPGPSAAPAVLLGSRWLR